MVECFLLVCYGVLEVPTVFYVVSMVILGGCEDVLGGRVGCRVF